MARAAQWKDIEYLADRINAKIGHSRYVAERQGKRKELADNDTGMTSEPESASDVQELYAELWEVWQSLVDG